MTLTPGLNSTLALYRKLEREAYRAYHQRDRIHKVDHFFNFCVTAHSLRDYFLSEGKVPKGKASDQFHKQWNSFPELIAVKEVANSSKHFSLWTAPETKNVRGGTGGFVDIYVNDSGDYMARPVKAPDIFITLSDGSRFDLYIFTRAVLEIWRAFLKAQGFSVRRQSFEILKGRDQSAA